MSNAVNLPHVDNFLCVQPLLKGIIYDMQEVNRIFILQIERAVPFEAVFPSGFTHFLHSGAALSVCNSEYTNSTRK